MLWTEDFGWEAKPSCCLAARIPLVTWTDPTASNLLIKPPVCCSAFVPISSLFTLTTPSTLVGTARGVRRGVPLLLCPLAGSAIPHSRPSTTPLPKRPILANTCRSLRLPELHASTLGVQNILHEFSLAQLHIVSLYFLGASPPDPRSVNMK
jgi:hypothetical protein